MLLAAAVSGLLASTFLMSASSSLADTESIPATSAMVATALILQRCHIDMPQVQHAATDQALEVPASVWLIANKSMPEQAQSELCAQLLSASLQGSSEDNAHNPAEFDSALSDTRQLMLEQIADQVQEHDTLAVDIAPLMGLAPSEVKHYFKAVTQDPAPFESDATPFESDSTAEDTSRFSV